MRDAIRMLFALLVLGSSVSAADLPQPATAKSARIPGTKVEFPPAAIEKPVVCVPGRFVVILPESDDAITYDPPGTVVKYPLNSVIVGVKWDEPEGAKPKAYTFPDSKGHIGFAMPETDVTISLWKNGQGKDGPVKAQTIAIKTGKAPQPPPDDNKKDDNGDAKPKPTAKKVFLTVIRDVGSIDPKQAAVLGNTPFWDSLKEAGHGWDFYTPDNATARAKGYVGRAETLQTPGTAWKDVLLLLDKDSGKVLKIMLLPGDTAGVSAALKEVTRE